MELRCFISSINKCGPFEYVFGFLCLKSYKVIKIFTACRVIPHKQELRHSVTTVAYSVETQTVTVVTQRKQQTNTNSRLSFNLVTGRGFEAPAT